jgi:putative SOS response-associated peptidase YedK
MTKSYLIKLFLANFVFNIKEMCGRYSFAQLSIDVEKWFKIHVDGNTYIARYNAAPGQLQGVITNSNPQTLSYLTWGLIPFWAKDSTMASKLINARSETILSKPAYNKSFHSKRCLIPADGFYEWKKMGKQIIPHHIRLKSLEMFAIAGIWDEWISESGKAIQTFSLITTSANQIMKPIHQRMPVILTPETEGAWLSNDLKPRELLDFLRPYPDENMEVYEVSNLVNSVVNEGESLKIQAKPTHQLSLF